MNVHWGVTPDVQVPTSLIEEADLPPDADSEVRTGAYCPKHMSELFSHPSGTIIFAPQNSHSMELPINLASFLRSTKTAVIKNGTRSWRVTVGVDYFEGQGWCDLAYDCNLRVGYKLVFFLNGFVEAEMLVLGAEDVEVLFPWSRKYHRLI